MLCIVVVILGFEPFDLISTSFMYSMRNDLGNVRIARFSQLLFFTIGLQYSFSDVLQNSKLFDHDSSDQQLGCQGGLLGQPCSRDCCCPQFVYLHLLSGRCDRVKFPIFSGTKMALYMW